MAFVPNRLSQRLTLGCIVLLILTAMAVFAVMALRGQPRVVAASGELIEQTGSAIVRQLALQLARWGVEPGELAFLDAPPAAPFAQARELLQRLADRGAGHMEAVGQRNLIQPLTGHESRSGCLAEGGDPLWRGR